jgi:pimeloyl-ACP methyl ester carboxylesterase
LKGDSLESKNRSKIEEKLKEIIMNYALMAFRLKYQLSSLVFSARTAENLAQMFLTPKRSKVKNWEHKAEQQGQRFQLTPDISAIRWGAKTDNKQILLVHGWESRGTQMFGLIEGLVAQGYSVVALDMPGHGHSNGDTSNAYIFSKTVVLAQQILGHFHAIIGHSMGAGATSLAVGSGVSTDKMVLISGPSSIENVLRHFTQFVGLNNKTTDHFIAAIGRHAGISASELDATKLLRQCDVPTLLIHDDSDNEVRYSESKRLSEVIKNAQFLTTQGLGHRKILKSDVVIKAIHDFVSAEVYILSE